MVILFAIFNQNHIHDNNIKINKREVNSYVINGKFNETVDEKYKDEYNRLLLYEFSLQNSNLPIKC